MRITWVASILLTLSVLPIHAQTAGQAHPDGRILAIVMNEVGNPIQQVKVWAQVANRPTIGALRFVETDADGWCEIDRLEFETFNVFAMKEDEGYPDIEFALYGDGVPHVVSLSPEQPAANVVLKLGPKAGVLTGSVTDKVTGKAIGAGFMLRRAKNPANFLSTSGASNLELPPALASGDRDYAGGCGWRTKRGSTPIPLTLRSRCRYDCRREPKCIWTFSYSHTRARRSMRTMTTCCEPDPGREKPLNSSSVQRDYLRPESIKAGLTPLGRLAGTRCVTRVLEHPSRS